MNASWAEVHALEARALEMRRALWAASPCAAGWSRFDGFVTSNECVPAGTLLQLLVILYMVISVGLAVASSAHVRRCEAKRSVILGNSQRQMAIAGVALALYCVVVLSEPERKSPLSMSLMAVAFMFMVDGGRVSSLDVFLAKCLDICYAMEPERAVRIKTRVVAVAVAVQLVCSVIIVRAFAELPPPGHTTDTSRISSGLFALGVWMLFQGLVFLMSWRLCLTAHAGVAEKDETASLRKRLLRLARAAKLMGLWSGAVSSSFIIVGAVPFLSKRPFLAVCGCGIVACTTLLYMITKSQRDRRRTRRSGARRVSVASSLGLHLAHAQPGGAPPGGATLGVHERGVSLAFLKRFAVEEAVGQRVTTAELCEANVKVLTRADSCSYFALLEGDASSAGRSQYFISHSWSYRFLELLRVLENFEARLPPQEAPRYYWLDIFVMNQHSEEQVGQDLLQNLRRSIEAPGKLLLLLDSWRDPAPLARCWCLFELYTAIKCGADITMCLSRSEEYSFLGDLEANRADLELLIESVHAEQAEATVPADRDAIFATIRDEIGFGPFNATLRSTLREALQQTIMAASNPFQRSRARSNGSARARAASGAGRSPPTPGRGLARGASGKQPAPLATSGVLATSPARRAGGIVEGEGGAGTCDGGVADRAAALAQGLLASPSRSTVRRLGEWEAMEPGSPMTRGGAQAAQFRADLQKLDARWEAKQGIDGCPSPEGRQRRRPSGRWSQPMLRTDSGNSSRQASFSEAIAEAGAAANAAASAAAITPERVATTTTD
eukprot:g3219.t1